MPKTIRNKLKIGIDKLFLRKRGIRIYNNTVYSNVTFDGPATIEPYNRIVGEPRISIGENFYLNAGCHLLGDISIGSDVMIGPKTVIWSRDHGLKLGTPMRLQQHNNQQIVIEDDVWIGANATILKGVTLGKGSIIAAGAVVTKDVAPFTIVAGNPAKFLRER